MSDNVISLLLNTPCNGEQARVFAAAKTEIDRLNMQRLELQAERERLLESLARAGLEGSRMVLKELERCAQVLRYWLAGYAADTAASHEARCLAHILDGRPAPEGPNAKASRPLPATED